jgi:UDP-glucose:tetrahydrobiopterin glucosyltransferase
MLPFLTARPLNYHENHTRTKPLKILFVSTPVGPLGSGLGGGVELTLYNLAQALTQRGHSITTIAPESSHLNGFEVIGVAGTLQPTAQSQGRDALITVPAGSVLGEMWQVAKQREADYDIVLNFAYDWLPFYLTPWFQQPVAHLVSMGSLTDAMDGAIAHVLNQFPKTIAVHSQAQAQTFPFGDRLRCLGNGFDLSQYQFQGSPDHCLGWVGRIAPEKGIEDAIAAAVQSQMPLKIWGAMPDPNYWQQVCKTHENANLSYEGFLTTAELQQALGRCKGLLVTPKWVEAFGNVVIEALACGVPVIAYQRGGPAEIVADGQIGWLVEPDSVAGLVDAIAQLPQLDRQQCRKWAEQHYSLAAMGDRVETWLTEIRSDYPLPYPS